MMMSTAAGGGSGVNPEPGTGAGMVPSTPTGKCGVLLATVRDFKRGDQPGGHPDFQTYVGRQRANVGLVQDTLDGQKKPVFKSRGTWINLTSADAFNQWYRDVPDVNMPFQLELPLTQSGASFVYDNSQFFPLDGQGFGNQGLQRNYHFTTEIHSTILYKGGEVFTFRGDDDVWIFVDNRLALDLGGLHSRLEGTITFDQLGLVKGQKYAFDIFHAERMTNSSNFRVETNIDCFEPVIN